MARGEAGRWRTASLAGLAGLALAAIVLLSGRAALIEAAVTEPFRVAVAGPHAVAPAGVWRGKVVPPELAARTVVRVDGEVFETGVIEHDDKSMSEGTLHVALEDAPGLRLVEVELPRAGGPEVVTDAALVGPFRERFVDTTGCGVAVRVAGAAIERLVLPPVRAKLLAAAQTVALLGPETTLEEASLLPVRDALLFRVALAGAHRIAVSGRLEVRVAGPRAIAVRLATLGPVEFTGSLRTKATLGAAALGAAATGVLAPVGGVAGYLLADRYVDRRARREVETRLSGALATASAIPLVPERAELIVGEPRSRALLQFCAVAIEPGGIAAHLALRPERPDPKDSEEASRVRTRLAAIPGPARHDVALPPLRPVALAGDVEVDLTVDAVDALLDAWTVSGLLGEMMGRARWVERVDAELAAWTTLGLAGIEIGLPPSLSPGTGEGWPLTLAGLRLELTGIEGEDPGAVLLAGRGLVRPHYDAEHGRIALAGSVDRLRLSCARDGALWPCFAALLELGEVEARLDALLAPGAAGLPGIEVRALLRERTTELRAEGLELASLTIAYPAPGVLRVVAGVE